MFIEAIDVSFGSHPFVAFKQTIPQRKFATFQRTGFFIEVVPISGWPTEINLNVQTTPEAIETTSSVLFSIGLGNIAPEPIDTTTGNSLFTINVPSSPEPLEQNSSVLYAIQTQSVPLPIETPQSVIYSFGINSSLVSEPIEQISASSYTFANLVTPEPQEFFTPSSSGIVRPLTPEPIQTVDYSTLTIRIGTRRNAWIWNRINQRIFIYAPNVERIERLALSGIPNEKTSSVNVIALGGIPNITRSQTNTSLVNVNNIDIFADIKVPNYEQVLSFVSSSYIGNTVASTSNAAAYNINAIDNLSALSILNAREQLDVFGVAWVGNTTEGSAQGYVLNIERLDALSLASILNSAEVLSILLSSAIVNITTALSASEITNISRISVLNNLVILNATALLNLTSNLWISNLTSNNSNVLLPNIFVTDKYSAISILNAAALLNVYLLSGITNSTAVISFSNILNITRITKLLNNTVLNAVDQINLQSIASMTNISSASSIIELLNIYILDALSDARIPNAGELLDVFLVSGIANVSTSHTQSLISNISRLDQIDLASILNAVQQLNVYLNASVGNFTVGHSNTELSNILNINSIITGTLPNTSGLLDVYSAFGLGNLTSANSEVLVLEISRLSKLIPLALINTTQLLDKYDIASLSNCTSASVLSEIVSSLRLDVLSPAQIQNIERILQLLNVFALNVVTYPFDKLMLATLVNIESNLLLISSDNYLVHKGRIIEIRDYSIDIDKDKSYWTGQAIIGDPSDFLTMQEGDNVELYLQGDRYVLYIKKKSFSVTGDSPVPSLSIDVYSPTARLEDKQVVKAYGYVSARAACEDLAGEVFDWNIDDWLILEGRLSITEDENVLAKINEILGASGAYMSTTKLGQPSAIFPSVYAFNRINDATNVPVYSSTLTNYSTQTPTGKYFNSVVVSDYEPSREERQYNIEYIEETPTSGILRVYAEPWIDPSKIVITTTGHPSIKIGKGKVVYRDIASGEVEFKSGVATVQYPIVSLSSYFWIYANIGNLSFDFWGKELRASNGNYSVACVAYRTKAIEYPITHNVESIHLTQFLVWEDENLVANGIRLRGYRMAGDISTPDIINPLSCSIVAAKNLARNTLDIGENKPEATISMVYAPNIKLGHAYDFYDIYTGYFRGVVEGIAHGMNDTGEVSESEDAPHVVTDLKIRKIT